MPNSRQRLDQELVGRGLVATRSAARAAIMAGDVEVNGRIESRAGAPVGGDDAIAFAAKPRFVSRGGEKLAHALQTFGIDVQGLIAADLGASTGGFTDCLLQMVARHVYAVDVGYGQLADKLRRDDRVTVMERVNARSLEGLPEPVDLVTIDVSFISLRLIFPTVTRILKPGGHCLPLIKPQFEAGRRDVGKGGVVRKIEIHQRVLTDILSAAQTAGLAPCGLTQSPLQGPKGNIEFLAHLEHGAAAHDITALVDQVLPDNAGETEP